jgi:hypothetical protein
MKHSASVPDAYMRLRATALHHDNTRINSTMQLLYQPHLAWQNLALMQRSRQAGKLISDVFTER